MKKIKFLRKYNEFKIGEYGNFENEEEIKFILDRKIGEIFSDVDEKTSKEIKNLSELKKQIEELTAENKTLISDNSLLKVTVGEKEKIIKELEKENKKLIKESEKQA